MPKSSEHVHFLVAQFITRGLKAYPSGSGIWVEGVGKMTLRQADAYLTDCVA